MLLTEQLRLGTVLQQHIRDLWQTILSFSRALKPSETKYSTFNQEVLAIDLTITFFQHFVKVCVFHILTDNKPLRYSLSSHANHHTHCQIRHLDYISQLTSDIRYVNGQTTHQLTHSHEWKLTVYFKKTHLSWFSNR